MRINKWIKLSEERRQQIEKPPTIITPYNYKHKHTHTLTHEWTATGRVVQIRSKIQLNLNKLLSIRDSLN